MCTQEAMQCPDGSWVGRSGPNCQFVCPGTPALPTVPPYYQPAPICPQLSYNLYRGLSDYYTQGQVTQLQQFLSTRYYQPVTGYFGSMTAANVAQFQREQSVYPITGGVGPLTRAAIARVCGGTPYPNPIPTYNAPSISGISGPTQLSVGQSGTWQVSVNDQSGSLSYSVVWGDEQQYGYGLNVSTSRRPQYSGSLSTPTNGGDIYAALYRYQRLRSVGNIKRFSCRKRQRMRRLLLGLELPAACHYAYSQLSFSKSRDRRYYYYDIRLRLYRQQCRALRCRRQNAGAFLQQWYAHLLHHSKLGKPVRHHSNLRRLRAIPSAGDPGPVPNLCQQQQWSERRANLYRHGQQLGERFGIPAVGLRAAHRDLFC